MPLKPTTRAQVDGHRFLARRARHAVVARDVRMLHDPLRRQSTGLTVGVVAAVLGVAGAAVLALLDPAPDVGSTMIMVGRDSGQMYVRAGEKVHPVRNLASARLVSGEPAEPRTVRDADIAGTPRGGLLGIPGAPSALPGHRDAEAAAAVSWTVCDEVVDADRGRPRVTGTSIVAREDADAGAASGRETGPDEIVLADQDGTGWLLRDGTRARIDLGDGDLLEILGLGGVDPRPVTAALVDPLPEVDPVRRPVIEMAGEPVDYGLHGLRIGQVFTVDTATGTRTHVALADGVQEVGPVLADVIRSTATVGTVAQVPPDRMGVPRSVALDVEAFPGERPTVLETSALPVMCVRDAGGPGPAARRVSLVAGAPVPGPGEARAAGCSSRRRDGARRRAPRSRRSWPTPACGSTSPTHRPPRCSVWVARRCPWTPRFSTASRPDRAWTAGRRWSPGTARIWSRRVRTTRRAEPGAWRAVARDGWEVRDGRRGAVSRRGCVGRRGARCRGTRAG